MHSGETKRAVSVRITSTEVSRRILVRRHALELASRRKTSDQTLRTIGKTGSIAIIERFSRTVKSLLGLPFAPPLLRTDLQRRLDASLTYYAELKPHHGLRGDTPADRYFEREARSQTPRSPPRARAGEKSSTVPFRIAFFRRNPRLLYLVSRTA